MGELIKNSFSCKRMSGQIALPFMLLVCGIIIEVSIAGAFIVFYLTNSEAGERFALRAFTAANAGFQDAVLQITKNKEYNTSATTSTYAITVGNDSASVSVFRSSVATENAYLYIITSTGSSFTRQKRIKADVLVNKISGEVQLRSITEEAAQ